MIKTGQMVLMTMVFTLFLPVFAFAATVELPETGQTTCYDSAGGVIACPGTARDRTEIFRQAFPGRIRGLQSVRMDIASQIILPV